MLESCVNCRFLKNNSCIVYSKTDLSQCDINNTYDKSLQAISHYKVHPEMLPFVGVNYKNTNNKLLIVAESHYDKDNEISPDDMKNWYSGDFFGKVFWVVSTAQIRAEMIGNIRGVKPTTIDNRLAGAINEHLKRIKIDLKDKKKAFTYIAYMNFFQIPVIGNAKSIHNTLEDTQVANNTFEAVIEILNPDYVLFISKKAWDHLYNKQRKDRFIDYICHPSSAHWNTKRAKYARFSDKDKVSGKEAFVDFLNNNKVLG